LVLNGLVDDVPFDPAHHPVPTPPRRRAQFELVGNYLSGVAAFRDEPEWARRQWSRHAEVGPIGYDLLVQCWIAPATQLLTDPDDWARQIDRQS